MVQSVEEFASQLCTPPLLENERFEQPHIPVEQARAAQWIFAHVTYASSGRQSEGSGIKVAYTRRVTACIIPIRVAAKVDATVGIQTRLGNILSGKNAEREAFLRGHDAGQLPVT